MAEQSVDDGGKQARSPGRARRKPLKPLRGECRAFSGVTVVTNARVTYTPRAAADASGARHSLRPLNERAGSKWQSSGVSGREIAKVCLRTRMFENTCCLKLNPKHSLSGARAHPRLSSPATGSAHRAESGFPPHGATPADQLSSALQTQNLDLNRSNFQSSIPLKFNRWIELIRG